MSRSRRNLGSRIQTMIDEVLHLLQGENRSSVSPCAQSVQLLKLEDRLLMSVTPMAVVADATATASASAAATVVQESPAVVTDAGDGLFAPEDAFSVESSTEQDTSEAQEIVSVGSNQDSVSNVTSDVELIVIDSAVEDSDTLLSSLLATDRTFRILRLDSDSRGLEQITQKLEELGGAQAIHLLTHGSPGEVRLGSTSLNSSTLASHAAELLAWQHMLTSDADILLYGCDVADGANGEEFLEALSRMTAADVAASTDATGAAELGGDWILEDSTGAVETSIAFDNSQLVGWQHILTAPVAGSQFLVNQETTNTQDTLGEARGSQNAVAVDSLGNYVVTWTSRNQDGNLTGVYARRYSSSGVALTNEIQVNQTTHGDQEFARVASDRNGNFVVTWTDSSNNGTVYARLFRADGTAIGNEFVVNVTSTGIQSDSSVAMNANGDFIIGWQGEGPGDTDGAFYRRFDRFGNALNAGDVQPFVFSSSPASQVSVAIADNGNAVLICDNSPFVQYRLISSSGAVVGTEGFLFDTTDPAIAMKPNGEFIIAVKNNASGAIEARWYQADGTAVGTPYVISGAGLADPSISVAPDGSYLLTWTGTDSNGSGIYAQQFDSGRNATGSAFLVNEYQSGSQVASSVAASTSLDYMIVWSGAGTGDSSGVYGRVYSDSTPHISTIADQLFDEDSAQVVSFRVSDGDTPLDNLILNVSSSNATLFTSGGLVLGGSGRDRTLTLTPTANAFGSTVITLTVSDGTTTTSSTFQVDVVPVNDTPVAVGDSYTVTEDGTLTVPSVASWYDSSWKWRQQVTFNNPGAAIVDEAVLVTLTATTFDYSKAGALGQDLRFVDADGTLLKHEIESWNPGGISKIWVRVPQVDANSTSDSLWMYYGNSGAADAQDSAGVWAGNASVMHLNGATLTDSASNGGTLVQTGTTSVSGFVGTAREFNGTSGSVKLQGTTAADDIFQNGGTISAWIYATGWGEGGFGRIADKASVTFASALGEGWGFQLTSTGSLLFDQGFTLGLGEWETSAGSISLNQWTHVALTYDSSSVSNTPKMFINGVQVSVRTNSTGIGVAGSDAGLKLTVGNFAGEDNRTFDGIIDEFRLSTDLLTASEINAAYRATLTGIVSLGSVQQRESGVLQNDTDAELDPLRAVLVSGPSHSQSFTLNSDGSFTYVPVADFFGTDTFTYQATDGSATSAATTVTISVTNVNDAPVLVNNNGWTVAEGNSVVVSSTELSVSDIDNSASQLTYTLTTLPANGRMTLSGVTLTAGATWTQADINSGLLRYVHDGSETASDLIRFTVSDGAGGTLTTQVANITITAVNDAPVLTPRNPVLDAITTSTTSAAITVSTLLGTTVTDADSVALSGIAVTGSTGNGTWQYSLDGTTWNAIGSVSASSALLLRSTDFVRLVGSGPVGTATLVWRAWDQTGPSAGLQGSKFNTSTTGTGGTTAFSSATDTAYISIGNTAPVGGNDAYTLNEDSTLTTSPDSGWFDENWRWRQKISFANSSGTADIINQAVVVTFDSSRINYSRTQDQGQDLRFVDRDGTLLSYEIERWNEAGTSTVWVRVPQIDRLSSTDYIWVYYGNSTAPAAQNAAGVWSSGQEAVLHLTSTPLADTSGNAYSLSETATASANGKISSGRLFDGSDSSLKFSTSATDLDNIFNGGGSISVWIRPTGWGENSFGRIVDKSTATNGTGSGWGLFLDNGTVRFHTGFTGNQGSWQTGSVVTLNTWTHIVLTYDSSSTSNNPVIYVNGTSVSLTENSTPSGTVRPDAGIAMTVGNFAGTSSRTFAGVLDEFQVNSNLLSSAEASLLYRSQNSTSFATFGASESGPAGVLKNDTDFDGNPLSVTVVSGPANASSFVLNSNGSFTYVPVANWYGIDTFTYTVSDGTSTSAPVTVTLTVNAVNDTPSNITLSSSSLTGFTDAAVVGTVTVSDADPGDGHTFVLSDSRFEIVGGELRLKSGISINPVTTPTVSIDIKATDTSGASLTRRFSLTVSNPNNPATISLTPVVTTLPENTSTTTAIRVASFAVTDDAYGTNTVSLTGANASLFTITGNDIFLRSGVTLDYETLSSLNVTVRVTDPDANSPTVSSQSHTLTISDVNEAPTMNLTQSLTTIAENTSMNTARNVATISISDDALGTNTLSISGADAAFFELSGTTLRLKAGTVLDYEAKTSYSVTVQLSDATLSGGPFGSRTVTVNVTDVNEAPIADAGGPYSIQEGDSLILNAGPSYDPEGTAITYAWDVDNDGQYDDATGATATLTWNQLKALTTPIADNGVRTVRVRVTDASGLNTTDSAALTVVNTAPVVTLSGPGNIVSGATYTLTIGPSDPGADTISQYVITWGDGQTQTVSGTTTTVTHTYLQPGGTRNITVQATDEDGTWNNTGGPLVVTLENAAPSNISLSSERVNGNDPGSVVGTISFTDPDFGDSHTLAVSDSRFTISGSTLKLRAGVSIDPSVEPAVSFDITVTDASGASSTMSFTLTVNHAPVSARDNWTVDGTQTLIVSSPSAGVLGNDSDRDGDILSATLITGPSHAASFILNADGTFSYRAAAGFSGVDTFFYRAGDGLGTSGVTRVTLLVNQPASISFVQDVTSVDENTLIGTRLRIGQFTVTDDGYGTNTIRLAGTNAASFELDGSNVLYLRAGSIFDYEAISSLRVALTADDPSLAPSPDVTFNVNVAIGNLNDAPVASSLANVTVPEDHGVATISTSSAFFDQDGDALVYSLTVVGETGNVLSTNADGKLFQSVSINSSSGVISYRSLANVYGNATLRVTVTDAAGITATSQFQLIVTPVNDAPRVTGQSLTTFTGQAIQVTAPGLMRGATDVENDTISLFVSRGPSNGTLQWQAGGAFVYTPNEGYFGTDSFDFAGTDGIDTGTAASVVITVTPAVSGNTGNNSSNTTSNSNSNQTQTQTQTQQGSSGTTSGTTGGSSTGTTGTTGGGNTAGNNSNGNGGAAANNLQTASGTSSSVPVGVNLTATGSMAAQNGEQETVVAMLVASVSGETIGSSIPNITSDISDSDTSDRLDARRFSAGVTSLQTRLDLLGRPLDDSFRRLQEQREVMYQAVASQAHERTRELQEELGQQVAARSRVVGSVSVVTTGFSVGYLLYLVRGGMLLSGLLTQIPTWSMLDPLMVIDGIGKDDDKESLESIMEREQARLQSQPDEKSAEEART